MNHSEAQTIATLFNLSAELKSVPVVATVVVIGSSYSNKKAVVALNANYEVEPGQTHSYSTMHVKTMHDARDLICFPSDALHINTLGRIVRMSNCPVDLS
jgi:hypothetical protein